MKLPRTGMEWIVDAHGCSPARLRSPHALAAIFKALVAELDLHPLGEANWHEFPGEAGVTGMLMLSESHVTCHTFPETGLATFNLYCCRARQDWPWERRLGEALEATRVSVRRIERGGE